MSNRLPDDWVKKIFAVMHSHYGSRWVNLWSLNQPLPNGLDAGIAGAMEAWAIKLAPYADKPQTIKKVLDHLPNNPPSLPEFMELLKNSYVPTVLALGDSLTEEQKEKNKAKVKELLQNVCKKAAE